MPERCPAEHPERATRMALYQLDEYGALPGRSLRRIRTVILFQLAV